MLVSYNSNLDFNMAIIALINGLQTLKTSLILSGLNFVVMFQTGSAQSQLSRLPVSGLSRGGGMRWQ